MDALDLDQEDAHEEALQEQRVIDAEELSVEINAANSATETLQRYYGLMETAEENGGVTSQVVDAVNIGMESIDKMFHLQAEGVSMEAIGERVKQVSAMVKEGLKKLWEKLVMIINNILARLKQRKNDVSDKKFEQALDEWNELRKRNQVARDSILKMESSSYELFVKSPQDFLGLLNEVMVIAHLFSAPEFHPRRMGHEINQIIRSSISDSTALSQDLIKEIQDKIWPSWPKLKERIEAYDKKLQVMRERTTASEYVKTDAKPITLMEFDQLGFKLKKIADQMEAIDKEVERFLSPMGNVFHELTKNFTELNMISDPRERRVAEKVYGVYGTLCTQATACLSKFSALVTQVQRAQTSYAASVARLKTHSADLKNGSR